MTKEEKLKILRTTAVTPNIHPDDFGKWDEALRSAINALSAIEDIKAEINEFIKNPQFGDLDMGASCGAVKCLEIIDKHISGKESE